MADSSQPEIPRKATKKKKNHYTKQKQEEPENGPAPSSRPEMKLQDMSITEKKRLTCFFYYGGERTVLPSGTFHYVGGVSEAMMIEDDMTKGELLSRIGSRLKISMVLPGGTFKYVAGVSEVVLIEDGMSYNKLLSKICSCLGIQNRISGKKDEYWKYTPLVKAALRGDWETADKFFEKNPNAITAPITRDSESALYLATGTGPAAINFVAELLKRMTPEEVLAHRDVAGNTPLHLSALVGNTAAAELLVQKNPGLLCIRENRGWLPVHYAAVNAKRETLEFLLKVTGENEEAMAMLFLTSGYKPSGAELLIDVRTSEYYDLALDLVHRYPQLAISQAFNDDDCGLGAIARQVNAFRSGTHLNFWERIIYDHVPVKFKNYAEDSSRVEIVIDENPVSNPELPVQKHHWARFLLASQKMQAMLWKCSLLVPCVKRIREQKQKHQQALQLVRYLIKEMLSLNDLNEYDSLATNAIISATRLGIHEVVEEIVQSVPKLAWVRDSENRSLFQRAVIERHENIFNLIYQMSDHKHCATLLMDESGNTILHLAGQLAPLKKLNLVNGAVLQMQRELQWFQEVKKFVKPSDLQRPNVDKETPAMVFTREHKVLVVAGGEWMKNTAYSCSISAGLIATVVFAAIITVPGGNRDSNGLPNFSKESSFAIFVISDALSLFTSTTSLLLFLSILTSRYAESDFLDVLPRRLINGLVTLFLSITTMIVAFSVSLYLALGHGKAWILVPVAALAYLPIRSFVSLQFPLLVDLISSTFGGGIFGKQSDKQFF
ncbi:hypothetical protein RHSIM_Rhsim05G0009000 [Rhododendron simsii]|uniref:PGG domain-containing protein n=1 Tax=Rhododendron simsii TaxID=118357 RepID=A0A834H712_RHOSS|nr:hypothetical protein RHSIM_Rhsim05G0009000 [Rhododendron simsii]